LRHNLLHVGQALTLVLSVLATTGHAQDKKAPEDKIPKQDKNVRPATGDKDFGLHRLTIQNGQTRTVHYFSSSTSPSENTALRELERAENEAGYVGDLQALRRQYLNTERAMESRRQQVQMALYGRSVESSTKATNKVEDTGPNPFADQVPSLLNIGFNGTGFGSGAGAGISGGSPTTGAPIGSSPVIATGFGTPTAAAIQARNAVRAAGNPAAGTTTAAAVVSGIGASFLTGGLGGFPGAGGLLGSGFGFGYPPYGYPAPATSTDSFTLQTDTKVTRSLANGIGDEGKFKSEMVAQMARQSNPEYASSAARALNDAAATVALISDRNPNRKGVQFAAVPADAPKVVVTLESNEKLFGYLIREDANWLVIRTLAGESQVRPAKVTRIDKLSE